MLERSQLASTSTYALPAVICLGIIAAFLGGCASTAQYASFAKAGTVYASAVDQLLVVAGNTKVDATSESLLQDDALSNQSLESYRKLSGVDRERLAIIRRLRTHARLLARYFGLLNDLAASDTPERAQEGVGALAASIDALGKELRSGGLTANPDVFAAAGKLVVGLKIRRIAREELATRQETIRVELSTQEILLKELAGSIQKDLKLATQSVEQRRVIEPLLALHPVEKPDQWVAIRRKVLTAQESVGELDTASEAAKKLREAFEDLVQDKLDLQRVNTLLVDLDSLLGIVELISERRKE